MNYYFIFFSILMKQSKIAYPPPRLNPSSSNLKLFARMGASRYGGEIDFISSLWHLAFFEFLDFFQDLVPKHRDSGLHLYQ